MSDTITNHFLSQKANQIRQLIITMLAQSGSGHPGGALGLADIFSVLYFGGILRHDGTNPDWEERDYVLLSNGHTCPVLYVTLALAKYLPLEELTTLRQINSRLQGHPQAGVLPGVEITAGPLGLGLSQACGLTAGLRQQKKSNRVICVLSDGEHQEGQTWEAYLFGAQHKLANLTAVIDRNQIQISGLTENVMGLEPLKDKIGSFGWRVHEIDGHNYDQIRWALSLPPDEVGRPTAIICQTIPGKGVDFMENDYKWHGKAPSQEEAKKALAQLVGETIHSES